jgi:hypothetical protein
MDHPPPEPVQGPAESPGPAWALALQAREPEQATGSQQTDRPRPEPAESRAWEQAWQTDRPLRGQAREQASAPESPEQAQALGLEFQMDRPPPERVSERAPATVQERVPEQASRMGHPLRVLEQEPGPEQASAREPVLEPACQTGHLLPEQASEQEPGPAREQVLASQTDRQLLVQVQVLAPVQVPEFQTGHPLLEWEPASGRASAQVPEPVQESARTPVSRMDRQQPGPERALGLVSARERELAPAQVPASQTDHPQRERALGPEPALQRASARASQREQVLACRTGRPLQERAQASELVPERAQERAPVFRTDRQPPEQAPARAWVPELARGPEAESARGPEFQSEPLPRV